MLRVSLNHKNVRLFCRNAENNINAWNLKAVPLAPQCEFNLDRLRDFLSISSENYTAGCHFSHDSVLHLSKTILKVIRTEVWQTCQPCHFLTVSPKFLRAHRVPLQNRKVGMASKAKCPMLMPWLVLAFPICTLWSANADCDGWVMVHRTEGGWSHPKRHLLWHSSIGYENHRHPPAAIKNICIREWHEGC